MNARAAIGHNQPPADPTPFDLSRDEIEGLFIEGKNWCDGEPITSQAQADEVAKLLEMTGAAIKRAEARRKDENKPFDDGKAAVQAKYNGLIGETKSSTGRAILLRNALRTTLTPWNVARQRERDEAARAARDEAERKAREAALAFQVTDAADLEGREYAEELARDAKAAEAVAKKAGKPVATGLRTRTIATLSDRRAFLNWLAAHRPDELTEWLQVMAQRLCDAKFRDLPGLSYADEMRAQ